MENATYGPTNRRLTRSCPKFGLAIWLSGLLALAVVMPAMATTELASALASLELQLPVLTEIGLWLGATVRNLYGISALLLLAAMTTMAAWTPIGHRLGRSFAVAGALVLLGVGATAASVQATSAHLEQTLRAGSSAPGPR